MDMPTIANGDSTLCSSRKLMKMVLVKICPKFHLMNMVTHSNRNDFTGYNSKSMIVRIRCSFSNLDTTKNLMDMSLFFGAGLSKSTAL